MEDNKETQPSSPEIAVEEDKVWRRRRSTLAGRRSLCSIGGRLSLAAPPTQLLQDQVERVEEGQQWATKLRLLLNIALREAVKRLEIRLPDEELTPELRAAVLKNVQPMASQLSHQLCDLIPNAAVGQNAPITSTSVEVYKKKTEALEHEYNKWKAIRRKREDKCHAAEMEFQEGKSGMTTVDDGQEMHLNPIQRKLLDSWPDCSTFIEEAQQAKKKAYQVLQEVKHTTEVVDSFLTVSRLQADSSYTALENLNNTQVITQPLNLLSSLLQQHINCPDGIKETRELGSH